MEGPAPIRARFRREDIRAAIRRGFGTRASRLTTEKGASIIHAMYKYRTLERLVTESMTCFRVVSVTGARQVGKTTLVKNFCARTGMNYVTLEDPVVRSSAQADPDAWLNANPAPLAIDEVQHIPDLFRAIKLRVDNDPKPGQYLITGSAIWLSMKKIGETLAGRVAILELWPFRIAEWEEKKPFDLIRLLAESLDMKELRILMEQNRPCPPDWLRETILRGGFPVPAGFKSLRQRHLWFESYLKTYLQRDVLDFVRIEHVAEYTRLIRLLAGRTAQSLNISALSRDLGIPQPTVRRYVSWLRTTYQCYEVPPYSVNVGKRLVRTPKHHWVDTAMAASLLGFTTWTDVESGQLAGPLVETWVASEFRKWNASEYIADIYFWRSHDGGEVDFLLEMEGQIIGIEVKVGHRIDRRDLWGLRDCREALGERFRRGIVLYGGDEFLALEDRIFAVPLRLLSA